MGSQKSFLFPEKNVLKSPIIHASSACVWWEMWKGQAGTTTGKVEKLPSRRVCQTNILFFFCIYIKNFVHEK